MVAAGNAGTSRHEHPRVGVDRLHASITQMWHHRKWERGEGGGGEMGDPASAPPGSPTPPPASTRITINIASSTDKNHTAATDCRTPSPTPGDTSKAGQSFPRRRRGNWATGGIMKRPGAGLQGHRGHGGCPPARPPTWIVGANHGRQQHDEPHVWEWKKRERGFTQHSVAREVRK